jgi:hypothetical protein
VFDQPRQGDQVFTVDGVPLGRAHELVSEADGSDWVGVVSPHLVAQQRELMLPLEGAERRHGRIHVTFHSSELEALIGPAAAPDPVAPIAPLPDAPAPPPFIAYESPMAHMAQQPPAQWVPNYPPAELEASPPPLPAPAPATTGWRARLGSLLRLRPR